MPTLRIIADENIPLVEPLFGSIGSVERLAGGEITRQHVRHADVLLVRSVTPVDEALMAGSSVQFVGTATIGTDHIETEYLHQHEIAFASAPGSNAESVVEYVLAALLRISVRGGHTLRGRTLGVIGCGQVGDRLAVRAGALGLEVLRNDPPLGDKAEREGRDHPYVPLKRLLQQAHILSCHVPLTEHGPYSTRHLIGEAELEMLSDDAWLVNTARGAVIDNGALERAIERGETGAVVLDVWEREPTPSRALVELVDIGTPHVAGYSYEGKVAGTMMLLEALIEHLGVARPDVEKVVDTSVVDTAAPDAALPYVEWLHHMIWKMYDIAADDRRMRRSWPADENAAAAHFTSLRRNYPRRRSFGSYRVPRNQIPRPYHGLAERGIGIQVR